MAKIFPTDHPESKGAAIHKFHARQCADMVRAYLNHPPEVALEPFNHLQFHKDALMELLSQPDCEGMRAALAVHDGQLTLALFSVDAQGSIVGSLALQNGERCPPEC